jgi:hypothetical protein
MQLNRRPFGRLDWSTIKCNIVVLGTIEFRLELEKVFRSKDPSSFGPDLTATKLGSWNPCYELRTAMREDPEDRPLVAMYINVVNLARRMESSECQIRNTLPTRLLGLTLSWYERR